jgi:Fic family protein
MEVKMNYKTVAEIAKDWNLTERTVRKYCSEGKLNGVKKEGKVYLIPDDIFPPDRKNKKRFSSNTILNVLKEEKDAHIKGRLYHKVQVNLTYNSNHIEGSRLTEDQTRFIFETNTIGFDDHVLNVDDIIETTNHFRCIDYVIDVAKKPLSEKIIKELHKILKTGTSQSKQKWFKVGDYKLMKNEVGGEETCLPKDVETNINSLLVEYNSKCVKELKDIVEFHQRFEMIHPFQDGNGRVGRLIILKECLCNDIVPFIIDTLDKLLYYRGLREWNRESSYLMGTCTAAQNKFKEWLNYFQIKY